MTFKDLKKRVSITQEAEQRYSLFDRLKDRPFWIWDTKEHKVEDIRTSGDCCFSHIIGLPKKNDIERSMFDYEKIIFDCLIRPNNKSHIDDDSFWVFEEYENEIRFLIPFATDYVQYCLDNIKHLRIIGEIIKGSFPVRK